MNKSIIGLVVSTLFMVANVHAEDTSAVVSIAGSVTGSADITASCTVNVSKTLINLTTDVTNLREQGVADRPSETIQLTMSGDQGCEDLILAGRIAYKFTGVADEATGKVLANMDTSEEAAQGVGVGLYDFSGNAVDLDDNTYNATLYAATLGFNLVKLTGQTPTQGNVKSALTIEVERL